MFLWYKKTLRDLTLKWTGWGCCTPLPSHGYALPVAKCINTQPCLILLLPPHNQCPKCLGWKQKMTPNHYNNPQTEFPDPTLPIVESPHMFLGFTQKITSAYSHFIGHFVLSFLFSKQMIPVCQIWTWTWYNKIICNWLPTHVSRLKSETVISNPGRPPNRTWLPAAILDLKQKVTPNHENNPRNEFPDPNLPILDYSHIFIWYVIKKSLAGIVKLSAILFLALVPQNKWYSLLFTRFGTPKLCAVDFTTKVSRLKSETVISHPGCPYIQHGCRQPSWI